MKRKLSVIGLCFALFASLMGNATLEPSLINPGKVPDPVKIKAAMSEFRNLSSKEKKSKYKSIKNEIRKFKAEKKAGDASTNTLLLVILAILLPPLAVYLHEGEINSKFWIDLILTLLFFLPGVIYALIVVLSKN